MLTLPELEQALPPHLKSSANQGLLDKINNVSADPETAKHIRDTFVSYASVLKEGKFKTEDYLNAVSYVTFKMMGYNNKEAYARAFPTRYQNLVAKGLSDKDISAYVSAYSKGRLVNMVLEQVLIPGWVLNQDVFQKAVNHLASLMVTAKSEKVQCDAANSLLTHLKRPEKKEFDINLNVAESSGMRELKGMLTELAEKQIALIEGGVQTREIAHQPLIEPSYTEIKDDQP